jgi:hypothetical protein
VIGVWSLVVLGVVFVAAGIAHTIGWEHGFDACARLDDLIDAKVDAAMRKKP